MQVGTSTDEKTIFMSVEWSIKDVAGALHHPRTELSAALPNLNKPLRERHAASTQATDTSTNLLVVP